VRTLRLLAVFVLGFVLPVRADFKVLGPVETLDNGVVTLDVALKVGRIVSFQKKGEANWLKVEDKEPNPDWHWNPYGGDRVWPSVQEYCPQIYGNLGCDPVIDGQPWKLISKTPDTLVMQSGLSPQLGVTITRKIELVKGAAEARIHLVLEKTAESKFPVQLWTVTAVRKGAGTWMEADRRVMHFGWKPFKSWADVSPTVPPAKSIEKTGVLKVPLDGKLKVGTYGRWVAMVDGTGAFVQTVSYDPAELYLEASNLQAYVDPDLGIYEIETLSPGWFLRPGERREWTVDWKLVSFPKDAETDAQKAVFLKSLVK